MTCSPEFLERYVDGELDAADAAAVELHLEECRDCAGDVQRLRELQRDVRSAATYYRAPADLRESIRREIRRESRPPAPWRAIAIAASLLLVASVAINVRSLRQDPVAPAVLASHIRSLMGTDLLDVESSDQHTVKPWFNGKIDYAPSVKDLAADGFPLLGGRIEYLDGRPVATMVYGRRKHIINLYTWPSTATASTSRETRQGYNLLHWSDGSATWWAVSDVSPGDLEEFRRLLQK